MVKNGRLKSVALATLLFMISPSQDPQASSCIDVALVLSLDSSASVSPEEFALQQQGIAAAFRDHEVLNAIQSAGRVAVSAVVWGSEGLPKQQTPWTVIDNPAGANSFARVMDSLPRLVSGDTGLGAGLQTALQKLGALDSCAVRRIINVSGDGSDTPNYRRKRAVMAPSQVKAVAAAANVEINALAISNEEQDLAAYYANNVITGPDAFVMEVRNYEGFADAIRRKLIREISPRQISSAVPRTAVARID